MEYRERVFRMGDDYEGAVIATLVDLPAEKPAGKAVLYLHGYIDYFFQRHMAEEFSRRGWHFYALDLRKCGRSFLPHQHPNYCRDLREYDPEIDRAVETIRADGHRNISLLGHSTGGLVASIYMSSKGAGGRNRRYISSLLLNSPFFEFHTTRFKRRVLLPLAGLSGKVFPFMSKKNELSSLYAPSLHRSMDGEWDYDLQLKPTEGIPLYFAWLGAVRRGQKWIKSGLDIRVPVLVMCSARTYRGSAANGEEKRSDVVLDVEDILRLSPNLGPDVTLLPIDGGMHDLVLSALHVRDEVFRLLFRWLEERG